MTFPTDDTTAVTTALMESGDITVDEVTVNEVTVNKVSAVVDVTTDDVTNDDDIPADDITNCRKWTSKLTSKKTLQVYFLKTPNFFC